METTSLDKYFDECEKKFISIFHKKFTSKISRARNKEKVAEVLIREEITKYFYCFISTEFKKFLIQKLYEDYEYGNSFQGTIQEVLRHGEFLVKVAHEDPDNEQNYLDDTDKKIMRSEKMVIRFFAKYTAYQNFIRFLKKEFPIYYEQYEFLKEAEIDAEKIAHQPFELDFPFLQKTKDTCSDIYWTGTNETEFVTMVYCLYHADVLGNRENKITNLVEELAAVLNYKLSPHWQSALSNSLSRTKHGFQPSIVKKILLGFEKLQKDRQK